MDKDNSNGEGRQKSVKIEAEHVIITKASKDISEPATLVENPRGRPRKVERGICRTKNVASLRG